METKYFIDRFTENTYTISKFEGEHYTTDICFVNNYHKENPDVVFTTNTSLEEIKIIYDTISTQQKDIDIFGVLLTELNSDKIQK